jgi:hypothetical protein
VITRPTTAQLLHDCARELREVVAPAVTDPTVRVRLEMLEQLLASCAVRSAHEIAWMAVESQAMERYAAEVLAAFSDSELAARLESYRHHRSESLELEDRIADYDRAGRAFAVALELALRHGHVKLSARARQLVDQRRDREADIRPGFYLPGRS